MQGWVSVSALAQARGVSKQAVSKQLAHLAGRVPTRKAGRELLVDVVRFNEITGADTDPAQALRNRDVNPAAAAPSLPLGGLAARTQEKSLGARAGEAFSVHRATREKHEAELSRLLLEQKMGKLVPVTAVTDAMVTCAQRLLRVIDALPGKSEDPAMRALLKGFATDVRRELHEAMKLTAEEAIADSGVDDEDAA